MRCKRGGNIRRSTEIALQHKTLLATPGLFFMCFIVFRVVSSPLLVDVEVIILTCKSLDHDVLTVLYASTSYV